MASSKTPTTAAAQATTSTAGEGKPLPTPEGNLQVLMDHLAQEGIQDINRALHNMAMYRHLEDGRGSQRRMPMSMAGRFDKMGDMGMRPPFFPHPAMLMDALARMEGGGAAKPVLSVTLTVGAVRASLASLPAALPDRALRSLAACSENLHQRIKYAVARHEEKIFRRTEDSTADGSSKKTAQKATTNPEKALPQGMVDAYLLHGSALEALRVAQAPGAPKHPLVGLMETLDLAQALYSNKPEPRDDDAIDALRLAVDGLPNGASVQLDVEAAQALFAAEKAADADSGEGSVSRKARAMLTRELLARLAALPALSDNARVAIAPYMQDAVQATAPAPKGNNGKDTQKKGSFDAAAVAVAALPLIAHKDDQVAIATASAHLAGGHFVPSMEEDVAKALADTLVLPIYRRMGDASRQAFLGRMLDLAIQHHNPREVVDMVVERGGRYAVQHLTPVQTEDGIKAAIAGLPKAKRKALVKALLDQMM